MSALRSYYLLIRWQALRYKMFLPLMMVVQALLAFGIVVGYPFLFPALDRGTILYLATGAPAITLLTMGLVLVPQMVAGAKTEGSLEYIRTLPVPRLVFLLADLTVWTVIVLPGVGFAIAVAAFRFGLDLSISPLVVPAVVLVVLTASCVGYAIASVAPPMLTTILTQALVVFVLMFSPLNFPPDRLPDWLRVVHSILPIQAMGEVIRGSLASTSFALAASSFALLGIWCLGGFAVAFVTLNRRG
jgi:ABC-2 type transport system permease protein